jgi:hypothetical protein
MAIVWWFTITGSRSRPPNSRHEGDEDKWCINKREGEDNEDWRLETLTYL